MRAADVDESAPGSSLAALLKRRGAPLKDWQHKAGPVSEEWHVLTWTCGCVASYVSDAMSDAQIDLQVESCRRHTRRRA